MIQVLYINADIKSMSESIDISSVAQLEAKLRELEAKLECVAERLSRLERVQ
jgi:hypothetical protein